MFCGGVFLGKEHYYTAVILLLIRMVLGFTTSELMYKRMKSTTREEVQEKEIESYASN